MLYSLTVEIISAKKNSKIMKGHTHMSKRDKSTTASMDMTTGSIPIKILKFSIPLMLAQILEVLFNMSDVAVVGKFSSYEALGAVGSTSLLVTLFTGFLIGMGCGVNVRAAQQLGAGQRENVRKTIHTSFLLCLFVGFTAMVLCIAGAKFFLSLMNTKPELIDGAVLYFRIYAFGMPAMAVYNFGNAVMSASGDTKKPLIYLTFAGIVIYLTFAGIVNVCLNLIFVIGIGMAEDGVAFASITAQYISAILVVVNLLRRKDADVCRLRINELRFYPGVSKVILMLGIPAGIQNAIFAMANLFIQTGVNSFSAVMVSGNAAAANADTLIYNVMMAFYTACSSFMGQNMGAHNKKRMLKSYLISMAYAFFAAAVLGGLLIIFGRQFLSLFTSEPEVVDAGMQRIMIMGFSYALSSFMDCTIAASRGLGKTIVPTIVVIIGSCVFRVAWVYTIFAYFHTIPSLFLLYPCSWIITAVAEIAYFIHCFRKLAFDKGISYN